MFAHYMRPVRSTFCRWLAMYLQMDRGATPNCDWGTIHERTQKHACTCRASASRTDLTLVLHSYQRLYFRNVNHPITRPSVVSRRQEPRAEPLAARADEDKRYVN